VTRIQMEAMEARIAHEIVLAAAVSPERTREVLARARGEAATSEIANAAMMLRAEERQLEVQGAALERKYLDGFEPLQLARTRLEEVRRDAAEVEKNCVRNIVTVLGERRAALEKREAELQKAFDEQRGRVVELSTAEAEKGRLEAEL